MTKRHENETSTDYQKATGKKSDSIEINLEGIAKLDKRLTWPIGALII